MYDLGPRIVGFLLVVLLVTLSPDGFAVQGGALGPVVIDGPWAGLPPGAASGLVLDSEWSALTLKPDLTKYAFVLSPDPAKGLSANVIGSLGVHQGRLYLGYGDIGLNLGPVNILAYDPLTGELTPEMMDVPEEGLSRWHVSASGRFYVGGADARESWTFGNFFVNDGLGWWKHRTIPYGAHTMKVVECQGRLLACEVEAAPSPVDYPHILVSCDQGASWSYECIDPDPTDLGLPLGASLIGDIEVVTHQTGGGFVGGNEYCYAHVLLKKSGGGDAQRLYRFDGKAWTQVRFATPNGDLRVFKIAAVFKNQIIVFGSAGKHRTYVLDHQSQREIPFPTLLTTDLGLSPFGDMRWAAYDGWLYWITRDSPFQGADYAAAAYLLYRTDDLQSWEKLGPVTLAPGAMPLCLAFVHGRLYVGARPLTMYAAFDNLLPTRIPASYVFPIDNSTLHWDANVPDGSHLSFKIHTASAATLRQPFEDFPWVGPDGTENTSFTVSGQALHRQHNGHDLVEVAIYRTPNPDGAYPHIRSITVTSPSGPVTRAVDEGSGLYASVTSTDPNGAEYLSEVFALQEAIAHGRLFFDCATPKRTGVRFQVRSGLGQNTLAATAFVGPDGSKEMFYESTGQPLWSGHDGDTHIQYRAVLVSPDPVVAPFLRKTILVTRADALDHLDVTVSQPAVWTAGQANSITVTARSVGGAPLPIGGNVALSAMAEDSAQEVRIQPDEVTLIDGVGVLGVSLERAVSTRIHVELAGIKGSSPIIDVQPGVPFAIAMTSSLAEPLPQWSPAGQAGQPFTLALRILDRYRNTVPRYTGTVRCERWRATSEGQVLSPYQFQLADQGSHEFTGVIIDEPGEWNLVCSDETTPQVAGTLTVNIE